jgi:hypothetical protein
MQRSDKDKGKGTDEKSEPARLELKRRVRRVRHRKASPLESDERAPIPPTAVTVVNGRLDD